MKRLLLFLLAIVIIGGGGIAFLIFTPLGNSSLKPFIEDIASKKSGIAITLDRFQLFPLDISVALPGGKVDIQGELSLLHPSIDADYIIDIKELQKLKKLTKQPFRGPFWTAGHIVGDLEDIHIKGKTTLAKSKSDYDVILKEFEPKNIQANLRSLHIQQLLYMLYQPLFASGNLNANIHLTSLEEENLDGKIKLWLQKGRINNDIFKKEYGLSLPRTTLKLQADALLHKKSINYNASIDSNILKLDSKGAIVLKELAMDIDYNLFIKELALLEPLLGMKLRGDFATKGKIKGDKKFLEVQGRSLLASGNASYNLKLRNFQPSEIVFNAKALQLQKLLYMLNQPQYSKGLLFSDVALDIDKPKAISGTIKTKIKKGHTNAKVIAKEFNIT